MKKRYFYVHIPKTAGTSFRLAAQKYFRKKNTFFDYGEHSAETSEEIISYVYKKKDLKLLNKEFSQYQKVFLSGHMPVSKYISIFEKHNIITFVRNPIEQVISHYKHHRKHFNYKPDFKTFIKDKRFKNLQSRLLTTDPSSVIGFIGLTEEYDKSIKLINDLYGFQLEVLNANITSNELFLEVDLDEETLFLIKRENMADIKMYENIKKDFYERVNVYESKVQNRSFLLKLIRKIKGLI